MRQAERLEKTISDFARDALREKVEQLEREERLTLNEQPTLNYGTGTPGEGKEPGSSS